MGTFLTTDRMSPALRARVERAVSHRKRAVHNAARLGMDRPFASRERFRLAKLFPVAVALLIAVLGTVMYVSDKRAMDAERAALLALIGEKRAAMPKGHEGFIAATDRWLADVAQVVNADAEVVDASLRAPGALDAALKRPAVYVRGPATELSDPAKVEGAARGSIKDAFLVCLTSPPASATERDLLAKVRGVYFGGAKVDGETPNVQRLAEASIGLKLIGPGFEASARAATERVPLAKLRKELEGAPLERAARAAAAEVLIVVADLPHGEARVGVVDLAANKPLYRARRRIAEQGTSTMASLHRSELEACSLAYDVRRAISGPDKASP